MSFYLGRFAELYDLFYRDKPYADEACFVYDRLCRHGDAAPGRVLELACGTGSHAIALAKHGCSITATDCSAGMLEVAKRKSENATSPVSFSQCDMQELRPPEQPYDAVVCLFDSIGYVQTDENLAKVFAGTRDSLRLGGLFLFEFWHAPAMKKKFDPIRVKRIVGPDETIIRVAETNLVPDSSLARVSYDLYEMRKDFTYEQFSETQYNRFFTVEEMEAKAGAHGFEPVAAYSGFEPDTSITDDTWHVVAVWKAV